MPLEIGWIDWAMLALLLVSLLVGALRGLVFEVLAIVGWFVAYFVALWASPLVAPHIPVGAPGSTINHALSFAAVFFATLIVWGILSRLARALVRATPLSPVDRVLGAGFGVLRGLLLLLAVAAVVPYTPAARSSEWERSRGAAWLNSALQELKPLLPSEVATRLRG